jgi:hypothetical protein
MHINEQAALETSFVNFCYAGIGNMFVHVYCYYKEKTY